LKSSRLQPKQHFTQIFFFYARRSGKIEESKKSSNSREKLLF
jgi:hypothetical protein